MRVTFLSIVITLLIFYYPILHSKAKHIEIKYHFIRDYDQKEIWSLQSVDTDHQWADIFTKPLAEDKFKFILENLNMDFCPE